MTLTGRHVLCSWKIVLLLYHVYTSWMEELTGKRNPIDKALKTNLDTSPKSEPALELISRAAPSVEAHHRSVSPSAKEIPEEGG